MKTTMQSWGTK